MTDKNSTVETTRDSLQAELVKLRRLLSYCADLETRARYEDRAQALELELDNFDGLVALKALRDRRLRSLGMAGVVQRR